MHSNTCQLIYKKVILLFLPLMLWNSCEEKIEMVDPISMEDIVNWYYLEDKNLLDYDRFNKENQDYSKRVVLSHKRDDIEFLIIEHDKKFVTYYVHGECHLFEASDGVCFPSTP